MQLGPPLEGSWGTAGRHAPFSLLARPLALIGGHGGCVSPRGISRSFAPIRGDHDKRAAKHAGFRWLAQSSVILYRRTKKRLRMSLADEYTGGRAAVGNGRKKTGHAGQVSMLI